MEIGYFWPAYGSNVRVETAHTLLRDFHWALMNGHTVVPWHKSRNNIAMARNEALVFAIEQGFDRLMMCDADAGGGEFGDDSALARLMRSMDETGAAAVAAPVAMSMDGKVGCNPVRPGERYPGMVATALMLIDVARLRAHGLPKCRHCSGSGNSRGPACPLCWFEGRSACEHCPTCQGSGHTPWFADVLVADGTRRLCGEDLYFCRRLKEAGFDVIVDYTFPTVHARQVPIPTGAPANEQPENP